MKETNMELNEIQKIKMALLVMNHAILSKRLSYVRKKKTHNKI